MCIIAAKPAGVAMPSRQTIRTMWDSNRDGAGLMYVENGKVCIEKGFMKYKAFAKALDKLESRLDLTATPVVMHFRITTHGGTKPENCHPFPITDSIGALCKRQTRTDVGVAHNGIIDIMPRKGISDTMEYIASQLAPLKRALPGFYKNRHAMTMVENAIQSKMAFLTKEREIYTLGNFIDQDGVLYSNYSFEKYSMPYRGLSSLTCYSDWDFYGDAYGESYSSTTPWVTTVDPTADDCDSLCWLQEGDYVKTPYGTLFEGLDYLIDHAGVVYEYSYHKDAAVERKGWAAYTSEGMPKRFDYDDADAVAVIRSSATIVASTK